MNRFRKRAARGSCECGLGTWENFVEIYVSIWYRGSLGEDEKSCLMIGASAALSLEVDQYESRQRYMPQS